MTQINVFRCDSCKIEAPTTWNGEHHLPPVGWTELFVPQSAEWVGHLCTVCRETAFSMNLRNTRTGKKTEKSWK